MNNIFEFNQKTNNDGDPLCYLPGNSFNDNNGLVNTGDLNIFLDNHFTKHRYNFDYLVNGRSSNKYYNDPFFKCKEETLNNNRDYFLVNDFSFSGTTTNGITDGIYSYNCYIPKKSSNCELSNNLHYLFEPVNNVINELFGSDTTGDPREVDDICSNDLTDLNNYRNHNNDYSCTKYTIGGSKIILPKKHNFILYKKKLVDEEYLRNLDIQSYEYYDYDHNTGNTGILNVEKLDNSFNELIQNLTSAMMIDICRTNGRAPTSFNTIDSAISALDNFYNNIFNNLQDLAKDISNISLLTKSDTLYLKNLEDRLREERKKLKTLFGVDGANNGKFLDVKYMKNLKLNEIIVISLMLIFLIFIISKKK